MLTLAAALLFSPVSTPVELASTPAALHGTLLCLLYTSPSPRD